MQSGDPQNQSPASDPGEQTAPEREYEENAANAGEGQGGGDPDVFLDVPILKVEELDLEVQDLRAHVSLRADLAKLVNVDVGVDIQLGTVKLNIKGVEAQALLKVKLARVLDTFDRALATIDQNPEIIGDLLQDAGQTLGEDGASQTPGTEPSQNVLGESPEGSPQTVRRTEDDSGDTIETTLNEAGEVVYEEVAEDAADTTVDATDSARKKAGELGVEIADVRGTGSSGRVLVRDVEAAAEERQQ